MAYTYAVETDRGTFEVELDREVPDTAEGRALLQRLVGEQLHYQQQDRQTPKNRVLQTVLDAPAALANTITSFISPDPPGGPRRRVVPEIRPDALQLGSTVERAISPTSLHTYEIELADGRQVRVNLPFAVEDNERGRQILARAAQLHLKAQEMPGRLATQAFGGARDAVQGTLDLPASILNVISEFMNPLPPHGGRQRAVPELVMPQLPSAEPPQGVAETVTRYGSQIGTDVLAMLALPGVRERVARLLFGELPTVHPTPGLMFDPKSPVSRAVPGYKPTPTLSAPGGALLEGFSDEAAALAQKLGLPQTMRDVALMSQRQASAAQRTLLESVTDPAQLAEGTPLRALLDIVEAQLYRFR